MYLNFEEKWWLIGKSPDASECESGNSLKDPAALKARIVSSDLKLPTELLCGSL